MDTRLPAYYAALCYLMKGVFTMAYAYGMRFDDNSNAITVIDEDNQTAVTTGYIDGEYVEFGGGGSGPVSVATMTVLNTTDDTYQFSGPSGFTNEETEFSAAVSEINIFPGENLIDMLLYNGKCMLNTLDVEPSSTSGNIESDTSTSFIITGDCSLTIVAIG